MRLDIHLYWWFLNAFEKVLRKGKHLEIYNIGTNEEIKIINAIKKY